jgi:hypothetical protein
VGFAGSAKWGLIEVGSSKDWLRGISYRTRNLRETRLGISCRKT